MSTPQPSIGALVRAARIARAPKVPAGWLTLEDLAKADGRANARGDFYYIAQDAVAAGILEKKSFRVYRTNGLRTVAHYKRVK